MSVCSEGTEPSYTQCRAEKATVLKRNDNIYGIQTCSIAPWTPFFFVYNRSIISRPFLYWASSMHDIPMIITLARIYHWLVAVAFWWYKGSNQPMRNVSQLLPSLIFKDTILSYDLVRATLLTMYAAITSTLIVNDMCGLALPDWKHHILRKQMRNVCKPNL